MRTTSTNKCVSDRTNYCTNGYREIPLAQAATEAASNAKFANEKALIRCPG